MAQRMIDGDAIGSIASERASGRGLAPAVAGRLGGPGGFYNIGNAIGLATGLGLQLALMPGGAKSGLLGSLRDYFAADLGALSLTVAMVVFFWSGETYHRAWDRGYPPDPRLNRRGDLLSALGAAILTVALALAGQTALALISGALLFCGKLGSAAFPEDYAADARARGFGAPDVCRWLVVASRAPALVALGWQIAALAPLVGTGVAAVDLVMPAVMFFCYLLWTRADFLLLART